MRKGRPGRAASTEVAVGREQGDLFGAKNAETQVPQVPSVPQVAEPPPSPVQVAPVAAAPAPAQASAPRAAARPQRQVLTVGELTRQIKGTIERGFPRVCVRGEVSGFRGANVRGHLYFSLKDAQACLDTKVWASLASRLKFKLREGMELIVEGSVDVYEPQGRYSLIASRIEPVGEGALALAFQQLKERLMAEGLFGEKRVRPPRPVPLLPRRIGVVTSLTGAALRDFLRVLHSRHPRLSVLVADARVQGEGSAAEVVRGIQRLSRTDVDVIVVTRGGGSIEDLWTFNEESVARAIFACPKPVVSAIGHEVDYTISDFVADLRCPTPSAAAERLAPVLRDLELYLTTTEGRLRKAMERQLLTDRGRLERFEAKLGDPRRMLGQRRLHLSTRADQLFRLTRQAVRGRREALKATSDRLGRQHPQARLRQTRAQLQRLTLRLQTALREALRRDGQKLQRLGTSLERMSPLPRIEAERRQLQLRAARSTELVRQRLLLHRRTLYGFSAKLDALSPLSVMARGYSVTFRADDGRVVRAAKEVKPGDRLAIKLAPAGSIDPSECDEIDAEVTSVRPGKS